MKGPFGIAPMEETRRQLGSLDGQEPCDCAECVRAGHGKPSVMAFIANRNGVAFGQWVHGTELKVLWERRGLITAAMQRFKDRGAVNETETTDRGACVDGDDQDCGAARGGGGTNSGSEGDGAV